MIATALKRRLLLCAGPVEKHEDVVTLDANPAYAPDIVATLPQFQLGSIRPEPWQQIYLIHGIEHFTAFEGHRLVQDMFSVLAPGGTLILEQPNLESAAKALLGFEQYTGEWERDSLWAIYGDPVQATVPCMLHKYGYTPTTLTELLVSCGFKKENIEILPGKTHVPVRDFRVEATKA